jgi:hypothetical protein
VFARGASVIIGNPSFDFGSVNTISANGSAASSGGVFGFLGSSLFIRDAQIVGNNGFGLFLSTQSRAQLLGSTIQGTAVAGANPGDGIRLAFGSALFATAPTSSVSANAGAGLRCTDLESSFFAVTVPPPPGLAIGADNGAPSTTCSGF